MTLLPSFSVWCCCFDIVFLCLLSPCPMLWHSLFLSSMNDEYSPILSLLYSLQASLLSTAPLPSPLLSVPVAWRWSGQVYLTLRWLRHWALSLWAGCFGAICVYSCLRICSWHRASKWPYSRRSIRTLLFSPQLRCSHCPTALRARASYRDTYGNYLETIFKIVRKRILDRDIVKAYTGLRF